MTEKRFTLFYEKTGKYFDMGIVDHETKEPFDESAYEFHQCSFQDSKDEMEDLCLLMNTLHDENEELKKENQRMTNKLNEIALELVDNVISQGKATEISEMDYMEFLDYRAKNNKPMELRE